MATILRGFRSTTSGVSAATKAIADSLLVRASRTTPLKRKQRLDGNQLQLLSLALNRPKLYSDTLIHNEPPSIGTPLPPGYHLAYFTPTALPADLGNDGTDRTYSPEEPFTRRMWAGGAMIWDKGNPLIVGDLVVETTELLSAEPKTTHIGEEMIVVRVQKTFGNAKGIALVDKRDWVFRKALLEAPPVSDWTAGAIPLPEPSDASIKKRDFRQTAVSLFRFSALTFNGHKIHYSRPWCREVEGHRDVVVHGPLNLINMLDFWRDTRAGGDHEMPKSIIYRATAPFYVEEQYRALLEEDETNRAQVRLWGSDGKDEVRVGMMGDIIP